MKIRKKSKDKNCWQPYFAWWPTEIDNDDTVKVWLEWIWIKHNGFFESPNFRSDITEATADMINPPIVDKQIVIKYKGIDS